VLLKEDGEYWLQSEIFKVKVPKERVAKFENIEEYVGQEVILGVRPEDIKDVQISPNASPDARFNAEVEVVEPMGSEVHLYLAKDDKLFVARVDAYTEALEGDEMEFAFDMRKIHLFDRESEERIR
jgi:multiple sugar transport system ATP-binding protein